VKTGKHLSSIENGFFIFTLMPSLRCKLNCPHCYLTTEQRNDSTIMSLTDMEIAARKVASFYESRSTPEKKIYFYWYGGEPTQMGQSYFTDAADLLNGIFSPDMGFETKHVILSSMVGVDESWFPIFSKYGNGYIQSSYDGKMRGDKYVGRWEEKIRAALSYGLDVGTISVVNNELLQEGAEKVIDYLSDLGIRETGWLPFMWNDQNKATGSYESFAPTMADYNDFMIRMTKRVIVREQDKLYSPAIGQQLFIQQQGNNGPLANIAAQTLFLMPNGEMSLPDYRNGWCEYLRPFGNILQQDFEDILTSKPRREYLRKQVLRNENDDCMACEHADKCLMEFWKSNRPDDECFGAKRYVDFVIDTFGESVGANQPSLY